MKIRFLGIAWGLIFFAFLAGGRPLHAQDFTGMIEPNDVVDVGSPVPGILEAVAVERGDRVTKGQVIATLKAGVEQALVDLARARVEFGKRKAVRNEDLYKKQLISIHEKDELETEIQVAQLQLREALERLELRTIRSPIEGVVTKRMHSPGEYVGETDAILTVASIDPLHVEVIVPLAYYGKIRKGDIAEVRPERPVGGTYRAEVAIVDQVVDAASGNFGVRLVLANPDNRLPAGIRCSVRFLKN
ncbi:MAG: efflux RND transporter periplasmic adaptor subunit [Deltaproteobacteria bacterium]|nr:efflux RND transporter periplasmic adaptor subunit [Deltaproteobacteria bacterium]MBW1923925.1 efflux RND transporter periplasmic adaptor subunit [Deltaproteobacteria bacterium]MBW1950279.1 efflux RND transporter periplasmic adaptor subunit [Deltaproteobacteria bacterium]MBW2009006.1 efflux RND transporter periplasmic adaptor subunit [Deltaproteobacteria bacterium]MBW2103379.1 efflux RND transporter periplasmic adaptor subunit [Deltaproteobacteria bacterium]